MQEGTKAMKAVQKTMTVEDVEDTMEQVREQMEDMQEIGEVLGQDLSGGMFDEDDLMAELEELEEEALDEALLDISVGITCPPRQCCPPRSRCQRLRDWRDPTCPTRIELTGYSVCSSMPMTRTATSAGARGCGWSSHGLARCCGGAGASASGERRRGRVSSAGSSDGAVGGENLNCGMPMQTVTYVANA